eukprot:XP_013996351.1 PREDICTED: GTPase IMAP family member 8-like isoform X2 [Salmo salar]
MASSICAPHAILLVVPLDTSFMEEQKQNIQVNMGQFGENVWRHIIVLFTYEDWLGDVPKEQHIESEGKALQWLVEKCGNRYHVLDNKNRSENNQVRDLLEKIEEMVEGLSVPGDDEIERSRRIVNAWITWTDPTSSGICSNSNETEDQ